MSTYKVAGYFLWLLSWVMVYLAYLGMKNGLQFVFYQIVEWPVWGYVLGAFAIMFLAKIVSMLMALPIVIAYGFIETPESPNPTAKSLSYFGIAYLTWVLLILSVMDFYYMDK